MKTEMISNAKTETCDVVYVAKRQSEVKVHVDRQFKEGRRVVSEDERIEVIEVLGFDVAPAHAMVDYARTINLGDYNSAKIQVGVTVPCYTEEVDDALEFASLKAKQFLTAEYKKVRNRKEST